MKRFGFTCGEWVLIGATVLAMLLLVSGIAFKRFADEAFYRTALFGFCLEYERGASCQQWRDSVYPQHRVTVIQCLERYDYFEYKFAFFGCLADAGL